MNNKVLSPITATEAVLELQKKKEAAARALVKSNERIDQIEKLIQELGGDVRDEKMIKELQEFVEA